MSAPSLAPSRFALPLPSALLGALLILAAPLHGEALQVPDPWVGTFQGDGLTLVLQAAEGGVYSGEAREGAFRFTVEGRVTGSAMEGTYALWRARSVFRAELNGDRMTVTVDGDVYELARAGVPPGGQATAGAGAAGIDPPVANEVDDPAWGVRFRVPAGWQVGEQDEGAWVLGSSSLPGVLLVWELEVADLAELRSVVSSEIVDGGIRLSPRGSPEALGPEALGVEVEGTLGNASVRGYAAGVLSPHGPGITVLAVTEPALYQEGHRSAARELAESVRFRPRPLVGDQAWWQGTLSGQRLARLTRTSSAGAGGSTSRTVVTLCRDGRAGYLHTYQMSMIVPGVSASDRSRDEGEGRWEVVQRDPGPVLVMPLDDGRVLEWTLSYQNDRIHLDGREFLRDEPVC